MPFPSERGRRLRRTRGLRRLARETQLQPRDLVLPLFVKEGAAVPEEIAALPSHRHETADSVAATVEHSLEAGCGAVLLFGLPQTKNAEGSSAWDEQGAVQEATRQLRRRFGEDCVVVADCCLCEYTTHGHCGVLDEAGRVDNDATLERYARVAVSQAAAGADVIAPSGMMDGQVAAIREALDAEGFEDTAILGYSAKFASVMYGPFRDAAECAPQDGDRRAYQLDVANARAAEREAMLDIEEGADMVMVKPALTFLDVVARVRDLTDLPLAAYCTSGEYAMLHHAAAAGAFDERAAVLETLTGIRRAGADLVISYHALDAARWLSDDGRAA